MRDHELDRPFDRFRRRGDVAALGAIFDATAPELLRVAMSLVREPSDADDLEQGVVRTDDAAGSAGVFGSPFREIPAEALDAGAGRFRLAPLSPGRYVLSARADDLAPALASPAIGAAEPATVRLVLDDLRRIEVRVSDAATGAPLPGARAAHPGFEVHRTVELAAGAAEFELVGLVPGRYTAWVWAASDDVQFAAFELPEWGASALELRFTEDRPAELAGQRSGPPGIALSKGRGDPSGRGRKRGAGGSSSIPAMKLASPFVFALSFLASAVPALAQGRLRPDLAELDSFTVERDGQAFACFELEGASGDRFVLFACVAEPGRFDLGRAFWIGTGAIDARGTARTRIAYPRQVFRPGYTVEVVAAHGGSPWLLSAPSTLRLTGGADCETLDLDERPGLDGMRKGEVVSDQYAAIGLSISADNARSGHPDAAIVFDPAGDTTNADPDLHTPLGKLLIVAENDRDVDGDGLVDVPDDEAGGGELVFDFARGIDLESITLVDIDDSRPSRLHLERASGPTTTVDLLNQGDGSVQELDLAIFAPGVTRLLVELGGSGGVALLRFTPCPVRLDLDESSAGVPFAGRRAGEIVTSQYACLGVTVSARNNVSSHPQKALLFDSSNPTAGDVDLLSPGTGPGNDEALGLLLVVAENDVDGDGDGLVDVPDDEGAGGHLVFDFPANVSWFGGKVIDVDDAAPSSFDLFDRFGTLLRRIDIPNGGDNSVQTIDLATPVTGVRRAVLRLGGSGGLAEMRFCPDDAGG